MKCLGVASGGWRPRLKHHLTEELFCFSGLRAEAVGVPLRKVPACEEGRGSFLDACRVTSRTSTVKLHVLFTVLGVQPFNSSNICFQVLLPPPN